MSEVRRDNKGRKLFNGESQRKDGKYEYKYHDAWGTRKTVYSWKLTPTDRVPAGKRDDISLREKIKQIQRILTATSPRIAVISPFLNLWKNIFSRKPVSVLTPRPILTFLLI